MAGEQLKDLGTNCIPTWSMVFLQLYWFQQG